MKTGVDIVGAMLRADPAVAALVPADRIKAGALPDGVALPALLVRLVSSVDRQPLKRGAYNRVTDRVAVTVRASSYREQREVIKQARSCCSARTGSLGGAVGVTILTDGLGPDVIGPAGSYEQTQDFRVGFNAGS